MKPKNLLTYLLKKYPDKSWSFGQYCISSNPNLTIEWIEKYPDKDWYWGQFGISSNPNLTIELIEKYPNKSWHWNSISCNQNITLKIIEKYINKINFITLSRNKFTYHNKIIKRISHKIKLFYYLSFKKQMIYDIKRFIVTTF